MLTIDPFLDAHMLAPRVCSIGGKLRPVAIRDQMLRGELFIRRAIDAGILIPGLPDKLLVIGAGAGGVAAALTAGLHGIDTVLIEQFKDPFSAQALCSTRWLDPTLYDFPARHWPEAIYPPTFGFTYHQLGWSRGKASELAIAWRKTFREGLRHLEDVLDYRPFTTISDIPRVDDRGDFVTATLKTQAPSNIEKQPTREEMDFTIALVAIGAGPEKVYLRQPNSPPHPTRGLRFWEPDYLGMTDLGLGDSRAEVLVSGSGDGALQDFIRIVTRCADSLEVYRLVPLERDELDILRDAEIRADRELQWGMGPIHDHATLQELHNTYLTLIERILTSRGPAVRDALASIMKTPEQHMRVQLMFECDHFSACYCINHYVALLIGTVLEEQKGEGSVLMSQRALSDITGISHECSHSARQCHGRSHTVAWSHKPDCRRDSQDEGGTLAANVLVLRHGIDNQDVEWDPTLSRTRQLLPFCLPRPL